MTTDLEKQFFDTFGIEPREFKSCDVGTFCPYTEKECGIDLCPYYRTYKVDYPAITDRILLELICIVGPVYFCVDDMDKLKASILKDCICEREIINHQVQALFKEK